jgi:hypothetical protein
LRCRHKQLPLSWVTSLHCSWQLTAAGRWSISKVLQCQHNYAAHPGSQTSAATHNTKPRGDMFTAPRHATRSPLPTPHQQHLLHRRHAGPDPATAAFHPHTHDSPSSGRAVLQLMHLYKCCGHGRWRRPCLQLQGHMQFTQSQTQTQTQAQRTPAGTPVLSPWGTEALAAATKASVAIKHHSPVEAVGEPGQCGRPPPACLAVLQSQPKAAHPGGIHHKLTMGAVL